MRKKKPSYPLTIYSIKVDYIEGGNRFSVRSSYHNQESFGILLGVFQQQYHGCDIESLSLVKVVFSDETHHSPEEELGKIPFPVGYDWIKD